MITMNRIGSNGGLGNQLFQYAALRSIVKKFKYDYCLSEINSKSLDSYGNLEQLNLFQCFKLNNEEHKNTNFSKIESHTFGFHDQIFNKCPDNIDLEGYFQDIKYFQDNSDDIKKSFTFYEKYSDIGNQYT